MRSLPWRMIVFPTMPTPFPGCGVDPTPDELDCASFPPCEEP